MSPSSVPSWNTPIKCGTLLNCRSFRQTGIHPKERFAIESCVSGGVVQSSLATQAQTHQPCIAGGKNNTPEIFFFFFCGYAVPDHRFHDLIPNHKMVPHKLRKLRKSSATRGRHARFGKGSGPLRPVSLARLVKRYRHNYNLKIKYLPQCNIQDLQLISPFEKKSLIVYRNRLFCTFVYDFNTLMF